MLYKNNKITESIIVAHPAQQISYRIATAFYKNNYLHSYCTSVYYKSNKFLYRFLSGVLGKTNVIRMKTKQNPLFECRLKQFNEILGLFFILLNRVDKKKIFVPSIYKSLIKKFGINVAKYVEQNKAKVILMYDTTAFYCFDRLGKKSYAIKIIDVTSSSAHSIVAIIKKDKKIRNSFTSSHDLRLKSFRKDAIKRSIDEIRLADYFLVPSEFVRNSIIDLGVKKEQIYIVHYGVDINKFAPKTYNNSYIGRKLKLLFVGNLVAAKGIYYLLEAIKQLDRNDIELILRGDMDGQESLFEPYKQYYTHLGYMLPNEMQSVYRNADIFIFPSLFEGYSLAVSEAMASGLPVILSENSGINDIITDGKEGFIVPHMNVDALKNKIVWFCNNKDKIKIMGKRARKLIENYTWDHYERNVIDALNDILNKNEKSERQILSDYKPAT